MQAPIIAVSIVAFTLASSTAAAGQGGTSAEGWAARKAQCIALYGAQREHLSAKGAVSLDAVENFCNCGVDAFAAGPFTNENFDRVHETCAKRYGLDLYGESEQSRKALVHRRSYRIKLLALRPSDYGTSARDQVVDEATPSIGGNRSSPEQSGRACA